MNEARDWKNEDSDGGSQPKAKEPWNTVDQQFKMAQICCAPAPRAGAGPSNGASYESVPPPPGV